MLADLFRSLLDVVSLRRSPLPRCRFHLTPLPVGDFGHIFAVLGDVFFVFEELVSTLDLAEREAREERLVRANRPEQHAAPDDIATALRELLSEVSGAAA